MVFFYQFINGLIERYPELYDSEEGYSTEHQANFARKWGSYTTIISLANDDLEKIDGIAVQPLEKCLLLLAYRKDRDLVESLIHNEQMAKLKQ
jgi:hypothetical protein